MRILCVITALAFTMTALAQTRVRENIKQQSGVSISSTVKGAVKPVKQIKR